ncbi:MAG: rRNA adenine N-6-methyltransferase family protein [Promethearchaeota archaeon]
MPLLSPHSLKKIFNSYRFTPDQQLGQSYLVNATICRHAVEALSLNPQEDTVLEIGPGFGAITEYYWPKAKYIFLIDTFSPSISYLNTYFSSKTSVFCHDLRNIKFLHNIPKKAHINLVHADILAIPFPKVGSLKIVSNIPFSISIPLFLKFLFEGPCISYILILQKEFFKHLVAQPGESHYTFISALSSLYFQIYLIETIPKKAYFPYSNVPTVLIKLIPTERFQSESPYFAQRTQFCQFIQVLLNFNWKNKRLSNLCRSLPSNDIQFNQMFPNFVQACNESPFINTFVKDINPAELFHLMQNSLNLAN